MTRGFAGMLVLFACAAPAAGCARTRPAEPAPAASDSAAGGEAQDGDDPIVCEKEEVPGSRMRKRVCRHRSEIRSEREANQDAVHQARPEPPPAPAPAMGGM